MENENAKKKITMKDRILQWLKDYGTITSWEAIQQLGCTRLSEYIRQLRQEHNITDVWLERVNRYGEPIKYKQYILEETDENGLPYGYSCDLPF